MPTTAQAELYREAALTSASDPNHPLHLLPKVPAGVRRILDVGCHAGHILEALRLPEDCEAFGCDVNGDAIELARKCLPQATFVQARAEELPYEDSYFDFAFARGAVLHFEIPKALRELNRVLEPGGKLWISLHRWKDIRWILKGTLKTHPIKTSVFGAYAAMNSVFFHSTGKLIRYPLNRSRIITFQTEKRMRRELQKAGFGAIQVSDSKFLVMEAEKTGALYQIKKVVLQTSVGKTAQEVQNLSSPRNLRSWSRKQITGVGVSGGSHGNPVTGRRGAN